MKNLTKILGLISLSFALFGCGGVKNIKTAQNPSASDSSQLIQMYYESYYRAKMSEKYVQDGSSPENAKIGVPYSLTQEYNGTGARHLVNFAFGGIGGMISNGTIQGTSHKSYSDTMVVLNLPHIFYVASNEMTDYGEDVQEAFVLYNSLSDVDYKFKSAFKDIYGESSDCNLNNKNCQLIVKKYTAYSTTYSKDSFPLSFKPRFESKGGYTVGIYDLYEIVNKDGKESLRNNLEELRSMHSHLVSSNLNEDYYLYIPASYNNGVPVMIDEDGKEHYFVK
jgi:hypothetical protein